jgi:hypothetical protein
MKKTQPLSTMPEPVTPISPITTVPAAPAPMVAATAPVAGEDAIPMALCWGLLAISAIVLLVQIWNYFS